MEIAVKGEVVTLIRGLKRPNLSSPKENWRVEATVEVPSSRHMHFCGTRSGFVPKWEPLQWGHKGCEHVINTS